MEKQLTFLVFVDTSKIQSIITAKGKHEDFSNTFKNLRYSPITLQTEWFNVHVYSDGIQLMESNQGESTVMSLIKAHKLNNLHIVFHETKHKEDIENVRNHETYKNDFDESIKMIFQNHISKSFYANALFELIEASADGASEEKRNEAISKALHFFSMEPQLEQLIEEWTNLDFSSDSLSKMVDLRKQLLKDYL